jgi:hypothetical protein
MADGSSEHSLLYGNEQHQRGTPMRIHERTLDRVVDVLLKGCDPRTLAGIVDCFVCPDAQPTMTDEDVRLAEMVFDRMTDRRPELIEAAQNL